MPKAQDMSKTSLGKIKDLSQKAAFLHKFVRSQQARIKRSSRAAAWKRDAHGSKEQALRTETELLQLVSELQSYGTVQAAFCHEWVEQKRQSQLSLHDLKLQCSADVAQFRAGCKDQATSQLAEQHVRCAEQMDQTVSDLAQEIRQLQDELERADHTMPQWWLKMQAQAQHHGSGQKNSAEQVADNTGAHDRCSTQHSSVLLGGTCAQLRESASEEAGVSHTLVDDAAAGVGLVPEALDKGSGNVFTLDDRQQAVCQDHQLDAEDWQLEAQASVQKLTRKYELASRAVCKQVHDAVVSLHENFVHAMKSLLDDKLPSAGALPSGWTAQESFVFQVNVRQTLGRSDILQSVQRLMPSKSMEELRDMDSHIWNTSLWGSRLQELRQKWIRQFEAVWSGCEAMLEHSVSTGAQHVEFCAEVVRVEVEKCRLANTCTIQQGCKEQRKRCHELEASAKQAREQSKQQHSREAQFFRQENNKSLVHEYTQYRRTLAQQKEQCQSEEVEMAKHHKLPAQLRNSERVKYRQQALTRKQEEALQQEELLAEEQRLREQRMERIRAQVQVNVKVDKERVWQPTKSTMAEVYKHAPAFADRYGYSEEQVTSDKRYRAVEMLKAKGVLLKPYARDLLKQMNFDSATAQRRDCMTTEERLRM